MMVEDTVNLSATMTWHPVEIDRFVVEGLPRNMGGKTILDSACGSGLWGFRLRTLEEGLFAYIVGLDMDKENLKLSRRFRIYDEVVVGDVRSLPFKEKAFDIVLACEVIEHLSRQDGEKMLDEIDRVQTSISVVTTPNGFRPEPYGPCPHISGWSVKDFKKRGYTVHGLGFKWTSHLRQSLGGTIGHIHGAFLYGVTPLSYLFPQIAEWLIARRGY